MNADFHNANFFFTALRAFKANIGAAIIVALGLLAVDWFTSIYRNKFFEYFLPSALVATFAFAIHHTILFGTNADWKTLLSSKKSSRFFRRSLIFFGVMAVIAVMIFLILAMTIGTDYRKEVFVGWGVILLLVIGMPLFGASFAFYGTMLPATVAETDATLPAAWHRAKGNFWYTFIRLAVGPFLVEMLILATVVLVAYLGVPTDFLKENGAPDPVGIPVYIIAQMANLFVTGLTASILCKTYLRAQDKEPTPAP